MFRIKLRPSDIDMKYSQGIVKKGFLLIFISSKHISIFIYRNGKSSYYWRAAKTGKSAHLSLTFDDKKRTISINNSNKLIFHTNKTYELIKRKVIIYKHMKKNENNVEFQAR
jgi:hypothetical protein